MEIQNLTFDEESAARPHLDAQLERDRQECRELRRQLRRQWKIQDTLRAEFPWLKMLAR